MKRLMKGCWPWGYLLKCGCLREEKLLGAVVESRWWRRVRCWLAVGPSLCGVRAYESLYCAEAIIGPPESLNIPQPYRCFFLFFLIQESWDAAGYVYPSLSRRVAVSRYTRTSNRQILPYPCFVALNFMYFWKFENLYIYMYCFENCRSFFAIKDAIFVDVHSFWHVPHCIFIIFFVRCLTRLT